MNTTIAKMLKQAQDGADVIRLKLLSDADARLQQRKDELMRQHAEECRAIDEAFGFESTSALAE